MLIIWKISKSIACRTKHHACGPHVARESRIWVPGPRPCRYWGF